MVKVRFAPSPTGFLHLGSARTALFNWLFAKKTGGEFLLRIEDTDVKRSKKKYLKEILGSLRWLGMDWDGIYFQSKRLKIYRKFTQKLLNENKAYREEGAIKFKVMPSKIKIDDLIHGKIEFDLGEFKDLVIMKSDGTPTYNFACSIDDALLEITHVIRGDDHISNTPKQIIIYQALNFSLPKFCHLPMILAEKGGRLSKRHQATSVADFKSMGYLPEALVNYLLLLGWSPGENREIISLKEVIEKFQIEKVNKTSATFNLDKLNWINNQYIRKTQPKELLRLLLPFLQKRGYLGIFYSKRKLVGLIKLFQKRINTLLDFLDWADFFFLKSLTINAETKDKFLREDLSREFNLLKERLINLPSFDSVTVEKAFRSLVEELKIDTRQLIHPVRVALTGKTIGPGLFEVISFLGKRKVSKRLDLAAREMKK